MVERHAALHCFAAAVSHIDVQAALGDSGDGAAVESAQAEQTAPLALFSPKRLHRANDQGQGDPDQQGGTGY